MITTDDLDRLINYDEEARPETDLTSGGKELERGLLDYDATPCNLKIDQTTNKEFKDANLNYLNSKLLNEMYEMAMFSGDMKFSLQIAEMLFTRTKLSDVEFISPYAAHYFNHRKNMIQADQIESVYKSYQNFENSTDGLVKLEGTLQKIGYKFRQQVLTFTPNNNLKKDNGLDAKIIRRGITVDKTIHDIRDNKRVNEKEYVLLVGLEGDKDVKTDPEFNDLLNEEGGPVRTNQGSKSKNINFETFKESSIFQKYVQEGRKVKHILLAFVNDISKDFVIKLYVLPTTQQSLDITDVSQSVEWVLVRKPVSGHHYASSHSLLEYTTRSEPNPAIAHILFSPPLTHKDYLR